MNNKDKSVDDLSTVSSPTGTTNKNLKTQLVEKHSCNCEKKLVLLRKDNFVQNAEIIDLQSKLNQYQKLLTRFYSSMEKLSILFDTVMNKTQSIITNVTKTNSSSS